MTDTLPLHVASYGQILACVGKALSDQAQARVLLALLEGPAQVADLCHTVGIDGQELELQLSRLRACGLVVAEPAGEGTSYELVDSRLRHALCDLLTAHLPVTPQLCPRDVEDGCCR